MRDTLSSVLPRAAGVAAVPVIFKAYSLESVAIFEIILVTSQLVFILLSSDRVNWRTTRGERVFRGYFLANILIVLGAVITSIVGSSLFISAILWLVAAKHSVEYIKADLFAQGHINRYQLADGVVPIALIAGLLSLIGSQVEQAIIAAGVVVTGLFYAIRVREASNTVLNLTASWTELKGDVRGTWKMVLNSLTLNLSFMGDRYVLYAFSSPEFLAVYAVYSRGTFAMRAFLAPQYERFRRGFLAKQALRPTVSTRAVFAAVLLAAVFQIAYLTVTFSSGPASVDVGDFTASMVFGFAFWVNSILGVPYIVEKRKLYLVISSSFSILSLFIGAYFFGIHSVASVYVMLTFGVFVSIVTRRKMLGAEKAS
ncbi:hypothetical protein [Limimaricola pyoseonensis]|uniref:hypothetical protein n=1 Tax=Limimaricola pyoseonensis TaxID=521013 RepID=UPI001041FA8C|nr:hypothetical protein [Limimaricola pyoseonensis]